MINIRHANSSDVPRIYELIRTIANHHDQEQYVITSPGELLESGFGSIPSFGVILAEVESVVIGYLSYTLNYSIWLGATLKIVRMRSNFTRLSGVLATKILPTADR